jgi:hypothetical protein
MQEFGKILVVTGLLIALTGGWLWSGRGFGWLGRLPGDVSYEQGDFRFYFPFTTCVLASIAQRQKLQNFGEFPLKLSKLPTK